MEMDMIQTQTQSFHLKMTSHLSTSNEAIIPSKRKKRSIENYDEFNTYATPLDNDPTNVKCRVCNMELQKVNFIKHCSSSRHKKKVQVIQQNRKIEFPSSSSKHKKKVQAIEKNRKIEFPKKPEDLSIKRAEAMLALYAVEHHGLIFEINHLGEICGKAFRDSKASQLKLDATKCIKIINKDLAPHFRNLNVNEINSAQKYSIIIDEISDANANKFLVIIVRYFSSSKMSIVSAFLALELLESSDAQGIVSVLINCLNSHNIPIQNMIGIGTDFACNRPSSRKTVHDILKDDHNLPNLVLIRFMCHSLQQIVSRSSESTLPSNLEFLVRESYKWFEHSSKRQEEFSRIYKSIHCGEIDLEALKIYDIRWLSIEPVIFRILEKWGGLKNHFGMASKFCFTANQLHSMYSEESNRLYLYFLKSILRTFQTAIKTFDSDEHIDPFEQLNSLILLLRSLCSGIVNPTAIKTDMYHLTFEIEKHLCSKPHLGNDFETEISQCNLSVDKISSIRKNCIDFTIQLVKELHKRIAINYNGLEKMELLSVQNVLKPTKDRSIIELAKCLGFQEEKVKQMWRQYENINFVRWEQLKDSVKFWGEVSRHKSTEGVNDFQELFDLARIVMTLPYSNGEVEGIFSMMMMTMLKHKMGNDLANSIVLIRNQLKIQQRHCHDYEIPENVFKNCLVKNTAEVEKVIQLE